MAKNPAPVLATAGELSEIQIHLLHRQARFGLFHLVVVGDRPQALGDQLEVGLVQDDLGQVLLPLHLLPDGVRHVGNDVGQDELGQVDDVLQKTRQAVLACALAAIALRAPTHLHHDDERHFGGDHVPVEHVELVLSGVTRRKAEIPIPVGGGGEQKQPRLASFDLRIFSQKKKKKRTRTCS